VGAASAAKPQPEARPAALSISRGQSSRAAQQRDLGLMQPMDASTGAAAGDFNAAAPAAPHEAGQWFRAPLLMVFALGGIAYCALAYIKQRRRKYRRRAKAVMLRDILASDDDDDDEMPLLGIGSAARYRGTSNTALSHMPVFDFIRKEFRSAPE
jgi:hypothetical protein